MLEIDPNDGYALGLRGAALRRLHKNEQALADFDKAIAENSSYAWAMAYAALLRQNMGDKAQMQTYIELILAINVEDGSDLYGRAIAFVLLGDHDQALFFLKSAIREDPYRRIEVQHDDAFDLLRVQPRFQRLMSELVEFDFS